MLTIHTQQTQSMCIPFVQRRPNVFDVVPTLYKCYTNVLCLPGGRLRIVITYTIEAGAHIDGFV